MPVTALVILFGAIVWVATFTFLVGVRNRMDRGY